MVISNNIWISTNVRNVYAIILGHPKMTYTTWLRELAFLARKEPHPIEFRVDRRNAYNIAR
uniref:Uncharacterized protein n=1 Tax=Candidatus Kentrum sp. FM TaxID=2126340 RepID=A0A450VVM7_9GAMM|nr:MAG: hypothetical protein BECKFM1743C_GA0114222_1009210 [Candidatus Kentron sp. FM]VFJ51079.1 MAG: hypothetical protein BECKFM1743A_GA0114220_100909 [Candidatus Kentron sp. FM]VFK08822.1 MAG: hypothetical protein BECKFM1743B_GA0114221_100829 [Candidatus Kentron sp. FM]